MKFGLALERTQDYVHALETYQNAVRLYAELLDSNAMASAQQAVDRVQQLLPGNTAGEVEPDEDALSREDREELRNARAYHNEAIEVANAGENYQLVNIIFENARTCYRRMQDGHRKYVELAASYLENARVLDQVCHQPAEAAAARRYAAEYQRSLEDVDSEED